MNAAKEKVSEFELDEPLPTYEVIDDEKNEDSDDDLIVDFSPPTKEESLAFDLIQAIFVPCILKTIDEICKESCYGCQLPVVKDCTQKNHECLMSTMSEEAELYFRPAVKRVMNRYLDKCRSEWHQLAQKNREISSHFFTLKDRNAIFDMYIDQRIDNDRPVKESILFRICHANDGFY